MDTNKVVSLPETLLHMSALVNLHVAGNPMRTPPYTVRCAARILLYFRSCRASPAFANAIWFAPQIASLGITAIRKYYADRNTRINRLMRLLAECGVGTDRDMVKPNDVNGFMNDGLGYVACAVVK